MYESIMNKHAINQIAYVVEDAEKAAREHSALFGSGPFFYMPAMTSKVMFKGEEIDLTMKTVYGQFGDKQIEMIQVMSEPNPYFEKGRFGFHHFSNWVDDYDAAFKLFTDAGFEPLFTMKSGGGLQVCYMDTWEKWGHYVEFHVPVTGMWDYVAAAAKDWDGTDPYREFQMPR